MMVLIRLKFMIVLTNKVNSRIIKIFLALGGIILIIFLWIIISFNFRTKEMENEVHYVPYGYIGDVHIFFDKKDGLLREMENNSRIYRIQKSGILKTKFKENLGFTNMKTNPKFFYLKNGEKIELLHFTIQEDFNSIPDSNTVVVFEYGYRVGYEDIIGSSEGVLTYIIDSIKNFDTVNFNITAEQYINWKD